MNWAKQSQTDQIFVVQIRHGIVDFWVSGTFDDKSSCKRFASWFTSTKYGYILQNLSTYSKKTVQQIYRWHLFDKIKPWSEENLFHVWTKTKNFTRKTFSEGRINSRASLFCYSETPSQRITYFFHFWTTNKKLKQSDIFSEFKSLHQKQKKWFSEKTALS